VLSRRRFGQQDEMIFNIFEDCGNRVRGTVIPDNYSGICQIRVSAGDREIAVFPTNEFNPGALAQGLHETGFVDFTITEDSLPGLSALADLQIHEAGTGFLLYRRFRPSMLTGKYLRLETHLLPLWRFDDAVEPRFQQHYRGVERLGFYGSRQIFHLSQGSIYASGRLQIKNFMFCVDNGFKFLAVLHEPYEELAERVLVLKSIKNVGMDFLAEREALHLRKAVEYAAALPITSEKALQKALEQMPAELLLALANPVVRQFSTFQLEEPPPKNGVAQALDILAQSAVIGLRSEPELFAHSLGALLNVSPSSLPIPPRSPKVVELAEMFRRWRFLEVILEKDLELYSVVADAHRKARTSDAKC